MVDFPSDPVVVLPTGNFQQLIPLASGRFLGFWGAGGNELRFRFYNSDGSAAAASFAAEDYDGLGIGPLEFDVAQLQSGNYAVVAYTTTGAYLSIVTANGTKILSKAVLSNSTGVTDVAVANLGNGNVRVTWTEAAYTSGPVDVDILYKDFDGAGNEIRSGVVADGTDALSPIWAGGYTSEADMKGLADGRTVTAWLDITWSPIGNGGYAGAFNQVHVQIRNALGNVDAELFGTLPGNFLGSEGVDLAVTTGPNGPQIAVIFSDWLFGNTHYYLFNDAGLTAQGIIPFPTLTRALDTGVADAEWLANGDLLISQTISDFNQPTLIHQKATILSLNGLIVQSNVDLFPTLPDLYNPNDNPTEHFRAPEFIRLADGRIVMFGGIAGSDGTKIKVMDPREGPIFFPGSSQNDQVVGTRFNDTLFGATGNDRLDGRDGNDIIKGGPGDDSLNGGAGTDWLLYDDAPGGVTVNLATQRSSGAAGNDTILGFERVDGSAFDDVITGTGAKETLTGNAGNDIIDGAGGGDTIDGGEGFDTAAFRTAGGGVNVSLAAQVGSDILISIEALQGSDFGDTLTGSTLADKIEGFAGNDLISGGTGADTLDGGDGNDTLIGGGGPDRFLGGDGDDLIRVGLPDGTTPFSADGGDGIDTLSLADLPAPPSGQSYGVGLGTGDAQANSLGLIENIEIVIGSAFADLMGGNNGENTISGGDGNDTISGLEGSDSLVGDGGDDQILGENGDDHIEGGTGKDTLYGGSGEDTIVGGAGDDIISGAFNEFLPTTLNMTSGEADNLAGGSGTDIILGGGGNDTISGDDDNDILMGGGGADLILGGLGHDYIFAYSGNDTIRASIGDDFIVPGTGNDIIEGSTGYDRLTYRISSGSLGPGFTLSGIDAFVVPQEERNQVTTGISLQVFADGSARITGGYGVDEATGIEEYYGSSLDDTMNGASGVDRFGGLEGNDLINTYDGDDEIFGVMGRDTIDGGAGNDKLFTDGFLSRIFAEYDFGIAEYIFKISVMTSGSDGDDVVRNIEYIDNTKAEKTDVSVDLSALPAGSASPEIVLGDGNDVLQGSVGADRQNGGAGNDILSGGAGDDILTGGPGTNSIDGGSGTDTAVYALSRANYTITATANGATVVGPGTTDTVVRVEFFKFLDETVSALSLGIPTDPQPPAATAGADDIVGTADSEFLAALAGNDTIAPGLGNDTVDAGTGTDVVVYLATRPTVTLSRNTDGSVQVTGNAIGSDKLIGVERLDLADGDFVFDVAGSQSAVVYRLYQAAFARTPDEGGFRYWADAADLYGISPLALAREFRIAPEFIQKYGANVSDYDYTYNMYRNVLGREPDTGGIDYWTGQVTNGVVSRDQLLIEFSESAENKSLTQSNTEVGFWVL